MGNKNVELLAPAGNKDAFIGAINAGADAVYLGGNKYSARAYADNFDTEEIIFCIRYAHLRGKKVYLTVNTLMKDSEINELCDYISPLYEAGLDACIVQDFGAFTLLREHFPNMELHASTQMTITGVHGANLLKEMGATRIVPAREISLEEIRHIKSKTGLELETFIHGAMCYSYSGQCLFSSILGGRSGNRGRCAQPCRLPYKVTVNSQTTEECYPLSLKDMCTIEHIDTLMDAGIDSFKIEGRMKKPEYSAGVTAIYRKYIDMKAKNPDKTLRFDKKDLEQLNHLYIRSERQDGYYFKQNGADMVTLNSPSYSGSDDALLQKIQEEYITKKHRIPITIYASVFAGEKLSITCLYEDISITVEGDIVEAAQKAALTEESIQKQMNKLGDTSFEAREIHIYTDNQSFCSLKALNELRRSAVKALEDTIILSHGFAVSREYHKSASSMMNSTSVQESSNTSWSVHLSTPEQIQALEKYYNTSDALNISHIIIESECLLQNSQIEHLIQSIPCYIAMPYVMRKKDEGIIKKLLQIAREMDFKGFYVRNIEEFGFLQKEGYKGEIRLDAGVYVWNKYSLDFWSKKADGIHVPLELNNKEWRSLFIGYTPEKFIYGRIPMMITANCVAKTTSHCLHNTQERSLAYLTDRYHTQFPVALSCTYCHNVIFNSVPVSLHKELPSIADKVIKKLYFTTESGEKTLEIFKFFRKIDAEELTEPPYKDYTTAHEKRGVL